MPIAYRCATIYNTLIPQNKPRKGKWKINKAEIIDYLQSELADLKSELDSIEVRYYKASHMERIGMAQELDKTQDKYYHFWMVCNDLGIAEL